MVLTARLTARQVALMLRVLTPTLQALDEFAIAAGEDSWEVESMAHGKTVPSRQVLARLGITRARGAFLWRAE